LAVLSEKPSLPSTPAKGVLLCIDNAVPVLEFLACVLEECGYSVLVSQGAKHGLGLFQTKPVDLVILDYDMPEMDGYSVALEMRRLKPTVPIIMNSAVELPEEAVKVFDAVVIKGASYHPLISEVTQIMVAARAERLPPEVGTHGRPQS
jgi:two-component system, OmpR family, response regulator VanR